MYVQTFKHTNEDPEMTGVQNQALYCGRASRLSTSAQTCLAHGLAFVYVSFQSVFGRFDRLV